MSEPNRLLLIDDDPGIRDWIRDVAEEMGYAVIAAATADEFFAAHQAFAPTVIVLDLKIPGVDGVELLRDLAERSSTAQILIISGLGPKVVATAERLGETYGLRLLGALTKPIELSELEAKLGQAAQAPTEITSQELSAAIEKGHITPFYQPKVALEADGTMRLIGAEALSRWSHPALGQVAPDRFIPLAEASGLVAPLTDAVLNDAVNQVAVWMRRRWDMSVAINLAPRLLTDLELPDRIAEKVVKAGVPPSSLVLEITESTAMTDGPKAMDILTRFRVKGFGLSLDDFGTGYSSLVELYRMPFDELKIDKSLIAHIHDDKDANTIVNAIIQLGHNLNLSLCAEGIEDEATLKILQEMKCDKVQGFHIGKAMPPNEFLAFAESWNNPRSRDSRSKISSYQPSVASNRSFDFVA